MAISNGAPRSPPRSLSVAATKSETRSPTMAMSMPGNLDATRVLRSEDVLERFMVAPTRMRMQMHMAEVMYAPTDNLTLMVMLPYHVRSMKHVTRSGETFSTASRGIGDVVAEALVTVVGRAGRT